MAVAHVETVKTNDNDGGSTATLGPITVASGSLLLIGWISFSSGAPRTVVSATLSGGGGQTFTNDKHFAGASQAATILSLANVAAGTYTVALVLSGNFAAGTGWLTEVSGAALSSQQDTAGEDAAGTSANAATGTYASGATDSFWYCCVGSDSGTNPTTITAVSPWTIPTNGSEVNGAVNNAGGVEYIANPGTSSFNGQMTITSTAWAAVGMAYKAAGTAVAIAPGVGSVPMTGRQVTCGLGIGMPSVP